MFKDIVGAIRTVLDRVIPDKNAREKANHELDVLDQSGDLQVILSQLEINKEEAKHPSVFVSGWRPSIGWTCSITLAIEFPVRFLLDFFLSLFNQVIEMPPPMELGPLLTILGGLLGIGGLRTYEKLKKVSRDHLK